MARGNGAALASHGRDNEGQVDAIEQRIASSRTPSPSQHSGRKRGGHNIDEAPFVTVGEAAWRIVERLRR
jgi:hypothetical protein